MSCADPNCVMCRLSRLMAGARPKTSFARMAELIESQFRAAELDILQMEELLKRNTGADECEPDALPLVAMLQASLSDHVAYKREHLKKYRAQLAELVGARVLETEKGSVRS